MNNYNSILFACLLALLLSCSGNFEPIPYEKRAEANSSTVESSSSFEVSSSSSEALSSSTEESSSSSSIPSSSSTEIEESSSSEGVLSSSSITPSSSSNCVGFKDVPQHFEFGEKGKFCDERDNIKYDYVSLGYEPDIQTWMAENLKHDADDSRCYNDNSENCAIYGRLYSWKTAKEVCPDGWHLPSNEEWGALAKYVDNSCVNKFNQPGYCSQAGYLLKGQDYNGINRYSFSAKLGGYGRSNEFDSLNLSGNWWSSIELDVPRAWKWTMNFYDNEIEWAIISTKNELYSVRCMKTRTR